MNTTRQLIEQLERESGKRVALKETSLSDAALKELVKNPWNVFTHSKEVFAEDYEAYQKSLKSYLKSSKSKEDIFDLIEKKPLVKIPTKNLVTTQGFLNPKTIKYFLKNPSKITTDNSSAPLVVRHKGIDWIIDGNHRLGAKVISGAKEVFAKVLTLK